MIFSPSRIRISTLCAAAFAAAVVLGPAPGRADPGPFDNFSGSWTGSGTIAIADGGHERIRCKGTYRVAPGGNSLQQTLRCASDSYRFDLNSTVAARGNTVSGTWTEESRNINGTLEGTISGGHIEALVSANAFAANFSMTARGNRQSVSITSKGELRAVNITLSKGG